MELVLDESKVYPMGWIDFFHTDTLNAEIHKCPNGQMMIFVADREKDDICRSIADRSEEHIDKAIISVMYLMSAWPITHGYCWLDSNGRPTRCNGLAVTDDGPAGFKNRTELLHLAGRDKVAATLLDTFEQLVEKANELLKERS